MKKLLVFVSLLIVTFFVSSCEPVVGENPYKGTTYTVTFISNQEILDLSIDFYIAGDSVVLPTIDSTDQMEFIGWYSNPSFLGGIITEISSLDYGDKTFYAKWKDINSIGPIIPNPPVSNSLAEALKNIDNFEYSFSYRDDDPSGDYSYSYSYEYLNGSIKSSYEYDGIVYTDYLIYEDNTDAYRYYGQEENGSYYIIEETDEYFENYIMYFDFVYLDNINTDNYEEQNGKWVVKEFALQEEADALLGGTLDDEIYNSLIITLNNGYIDNITITSTIDSDLYGLYHATYEIDFTNYGLIDFDAPKVDDPSGENEYPIDNAYDISDNTTITVVGEIIGFVGNNFYLSDGQSGIYVYLGSTSSGFDASVFSVGDVIKIKGTKTTYHGLVQITNPTSIELIDSLVFDTSVTTISKLSSLESYLSRNISMNNLEIVSLPTATSSDIKLQVSDGISTSTLFISQYLPSDYKNDLIAFFECLKVGDLISVENAIASCYDNYQIVLTKSSKVKLGSQGEVTLTSISTNRNTITVPNGTGLDGVIESLIVYKHYSSGSTEIATNNEYIYQCPNYDSYTAGSYVLTITIENFETKVTVVVSEDQNILFKPDVGSVELLEDVADNFEITRGMPSIGDTKALIIPVAFTDYPASPEMKSDLEKTFFGTSYDTGWESLSSYYYKSSYGKLNITGTVLDVYNTGESSKYYENSYTSGNDADYEIIKSALEYYDASINYADYDSDGDGYIDALYFIYTTPVDYESDDSLWWAYTYEYFTTDYEYYDGVEADYYFFAGYDFIFETPACGKQLNYNAETFIHETGHILGLDDYYDYDDTKGPDGGIGGGDMMDYNVGDHNPFSKIILGWTTPYIVTSADVVIELSSFGVSGDCVLICDSWNGTYFDEYYIIDYYTPDGINAFEAGYSGLFSTDGIRIYHIDARLKTEAVYSVWEIYQMNNSDTNHKLISLIQASGSNSIENKNDYSSNTDLFKVGDVYNNAKWYDNSSCNFTLSVIGIANNKATIEIKY